MAGLRSPAYRIPLPGIFIMHGRPFGQHDSTGRFIHLWRDMNVQNRAKDKRPNPQRSRMSQQIIQAHQALGAKIRRLRKKKGLSQEEFAALCGLSPSQMAKIEEGSDYRIPFSMLWRFATRLQISIVELLSGIDRKRAA